MKKDYIPTTNGQLVIWLTTFKGQIAIVGPTLGLTAPEITALQTAAQNLIDSINAQDLAKKAAQDQSKATGLVKADSLKLVRRETQRMKNHSAYTEAAGESLGIVGDDHVVDIPNSKPVLKLTKQPFGVQIDFNLLGFFPSVHIYKKNPGELDFSFLANDTASPYIDTAKVAADTRYIAYFIDHDTEVGKRSDEAVLS